MRSTSGTMDLNQLPLFVAVAESGSISEAARRLAVPKSTVSRSIARLEASLGVELFHRTTRQVRLTSAGQAFFEKAKPVVTLAREATESLPERDEAPSGTLRVTVPVDFGLTLFPAITALFVARYPAVRLDVHLTNQQQDLISGSFDVALRITSRLKDSSLVARKLSPVSFRLYATPGFLARNGTPRSIDELARLERIAFRGAERFFPKLPPPRIETDDLMFAWRCIREGLGVGALPTFVPTPDLASGALVHVLPRWTQEAGTLSFVHPAARRLPRKVTAFRDLLLDFLRQRPLLPT